MISFSSHRGNTQQLFDTFVRPMSRTEQHKKIKEVLRTREPPHPKFVNHMRTVVTANGLTKKERKERATLVGELSLAMKAYFGEDVVDVVDISLQNYGVSVRQVPCELAIVDLQNPDGLPMGTTCAKLPKIYSVKNVLEAVKLISPAASLTVPVTDQRFSRTLDLSGIRVITEHYALSMPSPLHKARRELVKAYCDRYPIFRDLLKLVTIFHYCIKSTAFEPLALAYHVLTFFLVRYQANFYVGPHQGVSENLMENQKLGERFKVAHIHDRGVVKTRLVDTYMLPRQAKPTTVDTVVDGIPVPMGTKRFNTLYSYLKWTLDVDFRAVAFNPGKGLVSRFPTDPRRRVPHEAEARMLVHGLLDRDDVPKNQQTVDWEHASIVIQDPFSPWENLSPRVPDGKLNRVRNMADVALAQLDSGHDLATTIESILHPSLKPPTLPGFVLESNFDRRPSGCSAPATRMWRQNDKFDEKPAIIEEPARAPSTDSIPSTPEPSKSRVFRTPKDLEGNLFR